jgi:RND superfamily putative drug exporter
VLAKGFGPGTNGPLVVALGLPDRQARQAVASLRGDLARQPDVSFVTPPDYSRAGTAAALTVVPRTSPQDARTSALVQRLRDVTVPRATAGTGLRALIGGETAAAIDTSGVISGRLAVVVGMAAAIFLDATLVRMVAMPSALALLGRGNWWFPGWLGRAVPRFLSEARPELTAASRGRAVR